MDVAFTLWVVLLLIKGLQFKDNWLGWFMFSRARYFQANLHDRRGAVDVWNYLPHCQVMLSQRQIESLLRHIQSDRKSGYVEGTVKMFLTEGETTYIVKRSLLIPRDDESEGT